LLNKNSENSLKRILLFLKKKNKIKISIIKSNQIKSNQIKQNSKDKSMNNTIDDDLNTSNLPKGAMPIFRKDFTISWLSRSVERHTFNRSLKVDWEHIGLIILSTKLKSLF
jgi:hypothetical protein